MKITNENNIERSDIQKDLIYDVKGSYTDTFGEVIIECKLNGNHYEIELLDFQAELIDSGAIDGYLDFELIIKNWRIFYCPYHLDVDEWTLLDPAILSKEVIHYFIDICENEVKETMLTEEKTRW